jgi:glucose-6-phosphate dehydrogenase assembly protein OpcA
LEKTLIVDLPNTTTSKVAKRIQDLRDSGGVVALGRVLTLLIETDFEHIEAAVKAANGASRLHPSRIIVLAEDLDKQTQSHLDAEIRVGGDAGASEVIILKAHGQAATSQESLVMGLLLPDAPVVAWWPSDCEDNPAKTAIGKIASRRITDSACQSSPVEFLKRLAQNYQPGDGDMAWTRITLWRAQITALYEQHSDRHVTSIEVFGSAHSPSAYLLASWLEQHLGIKAKINDVLNETQVTGIAGVRIGFDEGALEIIRSQDVAQIRQIGAPDSSILLPQRSDQDCLVEDMRFLGEDAVYGRVLTKGFGSER